MKNKFTCFTFASAMLTAFIFGCSCRTANHNALTGWQADFTREPEAIQNNYRDYLQKLPTNEKNYAQPISYLKDGAGQHAVVIEVDLKPNAWNHVLIYDKDNKRVKVIKYIDHQFRS